jgi:histidine triad (HIT) family protein
LLKDCAGKNNWRKDTMTDDLFLKIIDREIPAEIVYEDDDVFAFRDINPQAPLHVLVIPKRHIRTLNEVREEDEKLLGKLLNVARKIAEQEGVSEEGYRVVMNCNKGAGQTEFHIHLHLLGGRPLTWPPG